MDTHKEARDAAIGKHLEGFFRQQAKLVMNMTGEDLANELVSAMVKAGYAGGPVEVKPQQLLTYATLGEALGGASKSLIFSWLKEGMSHVRVGDSPRFVLSEVLEFLRARNAKAGEP